MRRWILACAVGALVEAPDLAGLAEATELRAQRAGFRPVQKLLDLSGLAWLHGDTFLAVHDAKSPDEDNRVRVSLLMLPRSPQGLLWKPLRLHFPGGQSSDLESAAQSPARREWRRRQHVSAYLSG